MKNMFVCYPQCKTCQKAKKWLESNGIDFEERHIKEQNPSEGELRTWVQKSGLPLKRFFNTSGQIYRSLGLSKKLPDLSSDEQYRLLAADGMLVKRPILVAGDQVLVGFKLQEWENALL